MNRPRDPDDPNAIVMLSVREVCARLSVSVSYLYAMIAAARFPMFMRLGARSRGLPQHVLDAWLWWCLKQRDSMSTLRDPVELPKWPPAVTEASPVRGIHMLRLPVVVRRVGLAKSHIYRNIEAGTFPRPAPLGRRVRRWAAHELRRWMVGRLRMLTGLRRTDRDWYVRPPRDDDDDHPGPTAPA